MEALTLRLLPYETAGGPANMALDEALLGCAASGVASLRFYGWREATVSLGYFQPERVRHEISGLAGLPWVRRATGGATLVHHHEVTYALALPAGLPWQLERGAEAWLRRMHGIITSALARFGVGTVPHERTERETFIGPLCFHHFAAGDLILKGSKVVGSAQRRQRGALLQHGAILLAQSPHTPTLPGIAELMGRALAADAVIAAVAEEFGRETGWALEPSEVSAEERAAAMKAVEKYTSSAWNRKR